MTPQLAIALAGCLIGSITDIQRGKIPNSLTLSMWAVGLAANASLGDWRLGVFGFLVAFAVHWSLWRLGVQKGGDAKLMIGIGALMGWPFMLEASVWYAVLYVPLGFFMLWWKGRLANLVAVFQHTLAKARGESDLGTPPESTVMIAGPIIAAATVCAAVV